MSLIKQQLIDSILRGWRLPKFYFLKVSDDPEQYEVVDGQQRLVAIYEFLDNVLPLGAKSAKEFGGQHYRDLPTRVSDRFDDFQIQYDIIEEGAEKDIKEFFQRLQEGLPLSASERLNSVHSKLRDFLRTLAGHQFFKEKVAIDDKRYAYFDITSKVAAIELEGLDTGLRYDDLKALFEAQSSFSSRSNVAQRLRQTFDYLNRVFKERSALLKNRTVVQSVAILVSKLVSGGRAAGAEGKLLSFFGGFMAELSRQAELGEAATDVDYVRFQNSINANVRTGARVRHEVLLRKLLAFDPSFYDLLDLTAIADSGPTASLKETGERIAKLVKVINEAYSATAGEDLFKPTNRTVAALTQLGKRIGTMDDYKRFIDDAYFLFRESPGNRLDPNPPQSFTDVNQLRTDLQHDVDHGERKKVAAKKKKIGTVFRKYSGESSPFTIGPERFPLVQANLLSALESDLLLLVPRFAKAGA